MIALAQSMVILATLFLTMVAGFIVYRPSDVSWTVGLTIISLAYAGWIAISSWKELRIKRKPKGDICSG